MKMKHALLSSLLLSGFGIPAVAATGDLELSGLFSDHMVLQQNKAIVVSGYAPAGARLDVTFDSVTVSATAGESGTWSAQFDAKPAGGPFQLDVSTETGSSLTVRDILVGDVFLCSGQSNMEMPVSRVRNAPSEIGRGHDPTIRHYRLRYEVSRVERSVLAERSEWAIAGKDTVGAFSAACYFFAKELKKNSAHPIGLINASWGGSQIEAWIAARYLRQVQGNAESLDILQLSTVDEDAANAALGRQWQAWWQDISGGQSPWLQSVDTTDDWLPVPRLTSWKNYGDPTLETHDGVVWYRHTFELGEPDAQAAATLSLGKIEKSEVVFVNGRYVGRSKGWAPTREYDIDAGVLRAGNNQILINVASYWGDGGLVSGAEEFALRPANGEPLPLNNGWEYRRETTIDYFEPTIPWGTTSGLTGMYNAMIAPLRDHAIRAAIWYQGESNTRRASRYVDLLDALVRNWREQFGADVPFVVVQLPEFGRASEDPEESDWSNLREAQRRAAERIPNTGLVLAMGLGDATDIHPTNKQDLARRIANVYGALIGERDGTIDGHAPRRVRQSRAGIHVEFDAASGPLQTRSSNTVIAFEVCGSEPLECAYVDGIVDENRIVLAAHHVANATRVRYCWGNTPSCNLYAGDGLPVGPFEADIE